MTEPSASAIGSDKRSVHIFDLDDTLVRSEARIWVRNPDGGTAFALSPEEFSAYALRPDEVFDFSEFSDLGVLSRGIPVKYTEAIIANILKHAPRSRFGILTARADKHLHAPFLIRFFKSRFGARLAKNRIFAVSDERFLRYKDGLGREGRFGGKNFSALSVAQRKAWVLAEELAARGYDKISFYDDSRANLEAFKALLKAFPGIEYKPHFIDPTWTVRLSEFCAGHAPRKRLTKGAESARLILENHSIFRSDPEAGLAELLSGGSVPLTGYPVRLAQAAGKFHLERIF